MSVCAVVKTNGTTSCACLCTTYCSFEVEQSAGLGLTGLFIGYNLAYLVELVAKAHFAGGIDILQHHIVIHSHVARCLVCNMHVVALLNKAVECSSHGDYIVVGVR